MPSLQVISMLGDHVLDQFLGMQAFRATLSTFTHKSAWMLEKVLERAIKQLEDPEQQFQPITYREMYRIVMPKLALTKRFGGWLISLFNKGLRLPVKKLLSKWREWRGKDAGDGELIDDQKIESLIENLLETEYGKVSVPFVSLFSPLLNMLSLQSGRVASAFQPRRTMGRETTRVRCASC